MESTKAVSFMEGITEEQSVSSRILKIKWNIAIYIKSRYL